MRAEFAFDVRRQTGARGVHRDACEKGLEVSKKNSAQNLRRRVAGRYCSLRASSVMDIHADGRFAHRVVTGRGLNFVKGKHKIGARRFNGCPGGSISYSRKPSVCRSGKLKSNRIVSAVSMARSEYLRGAPRCPVDFAFHALIALGVIHRVMSPRWTKAFSYSAQLVTR
ncbi:MAG: hypothetical protein ACI8X5_003708 [Planctomycetota bacterium]|jgi:hypothetical protein